MSPKRENLSRVEGLSLKATSWVGTPISILMHTLFFVGIFGLSLFGISLDKILLILTTLVSLEAIYLAIFIQMTVNRNTESLEEVEEDIEDIQEDVGEISEEVEELGEDVDEIQEDLEEIQEDAEEDDAKDKATHVTLEQISQNLHKLLEDIEVLKKEKNS